MSEQPVLLIVAGPNGSGKTTLTKQLRASGIDLGFYINADVIAEGLAGSYESQVAEAQRIADMQRQDCLDRRVSFSFETVMSHPSKIDILRQARSKDYIVTVYFVATESPALNVARVEQRVALGGHDVPHDRIVARYERTMRLLPQAIMQCDRAVLFDNSLRHLPSDDVMLTPVCEIVRHGDVESNKIPAVFQIHTASQIPGWVSRAISVLQMTTATATQRKADPERT